MKHIRKFNLFESKINAIRIEIPYETYEKDSKGYYTKNRIKGKSKIIDYADRKVVLFDINGVRVPFYLSSGHAGKKDVLAGKWYPFFGIGSDYWFNKGYQSDINKYYEIDILKSIAQSLDSQIGDIRSDKTIPQVAPDGIHLDVINKDLTPTEHGMPYTVNKFYDSVKKIKQKLESLNENSSFDPMYYQIDEEEFVKLANNPETFKSEIDQIEKILKKDWSEIVVTHSSKMIIQTKIGSDIVGFKLIIFKIYKSIDEWFLVERESYRDTIYYKCDQMDGLMELLEDEGVVNLSISESSMSSDEIQDYFLEITDEENDHVVIEDKTQEELNFMWGNRSYFNPDPIYLNSNRVDKYGVKKISTFDPSKDEVTYMMFTINHPKYRIKGNLDLKGYTLDTIQYYLKKFVRHSKVPVNIYVREVTTSMYDDPLSTSIVRIEFIN